MQYLTEFLKALEEAAGRIKEISERVQEKMATEMEKAYREALEKVAAFGALEELADLATDPEKTELVKKPTCYREPVLPPVSMAKHLLKYFPVGFE